ncbi:hypothetical protein [Nocardia grenadensis]|uniref:hypothetical protein n=1 Tax=Nocardia grenadensis TaxID=931537 RepID=UPI0007A51DA9|nr:hypothetical protein [Nocardia grenadensis]
MSPRKFVRTVFLAVSAAVALSLGPAVLSAPAALAAPGEFPFDGQGGSKSESENRTPENRDQENRALENDLGKRVEEAGERAEEAGGGMVTQAIDMSADMLKCGLHIATPAIECPLNS